MNKYLVAMMTLSVIGIYSNWNDLSQVFVASQGLQMQEFDPQIANRYTTSELKMFLADKASMDPAQIQSISKMLYERESTEAPSQRDCKDCELSLRNVSEALRDSQKRVEKLEGQIESGSAFKWINAALFLLFGGYAAFLEHKKSFASENANHYERRINLVTFSWAFISSLVGLLF